MQRLISRVLFVLCVSLAISLALFPDVASAQAGAQEAFQKAQATFKAGNFADAQKFAEEASQTDTKNPEVFLLLGKAHYQQGHLEEALKAWKKTLALAPKQPYAQKMLDALQAEQKDIDLRIKLLEAMSDRKLSQTGLFECHRLLSNKAITNAQRAAIMMLQAKMHLRAGEHKRALETLQKVKVLYPKHIDPAQILLLTGQAKLHLDQKSIAEGIAALEEVLERHPKHSAATVAKYGLILFLLQQEVTAERTDALAKWLATHKNHDLALEGFEQLLKAYMMLSLRDVKPNPDSPMSKGDQMVFAIAGELYQRSFDVDYTKAITQKLLKHIETRYMNREAYTAAVEATDTLLKTPLSQADRLAVLKFSLTPKMNIAMKWLQEQARTGQLANDRGKSELPKVLVDLRTVYETIRKEYPANAHWQKQVELACRVKKFAQKVPWPREITEARLPEQWAMELALPAIKANATPAAVRSAIRMVLEIGLQVPRTNMASRKLAVSFSSQLMEIVPVEHDMWRDVAHTYCTLLKETANYTFNKNIKAGRPEANAKFSASQEAILDTMEKFVKAYGDYAPIALQQLSEFCKPLVEHNHWKLVEEAHMRIAMVLPESQRQQVELALGNLWLKKVSDEHQRLTGAGLTVPRKLDPIHTKILTRCYELQAEYDRDSIELKMIRSLQDRIVNHYKILEYYDIAKKAIRVKAKTPVKAADEYAAFSLIRLDEQLAQREFDRLMKQYNASEKTEIKTAFDKVLDRWIKFIAERPTSPLVHSAVEHVFSIGQLLERKQVYGGAVAVYEKFAKEAAKIKVLNQAKPHETTITQRAAFAAACAEDAKARAALKKWIADRKSDDPAPTELSKEFTAAIGAYKKFITTYPKNSQVAYAMEKIMAIACEYTKIDAWDVADSIFADLLKDKATFRHPERLKFARGLCQLGHARPEHARKLLKVLAQNGMLRSANEPNTSQMLAANFQNMHLYGLAGAYHASGRLSNSGGVIAPAELNMRSLAAVNDRPNMEMGGGMGRFGGKNEAKAEDLVRIAQTSPAGRPSSGELTCAPCEPTPCAERPSDSKPERSFGLATPTFDNGRARRDVEMLAMVQQQEANQAAQVALMRENQSRWVARSQQGQQSINNNAYQIQLNVCQVFETLSAAELARQEKAIEAAYKIFQEIVKEYSETATATLARTEILATVTYWRSIGQPKRAAALAKQFLKDNPTDRDLPSLRLQIARDWLTWAAMPVVEITSKQEKLSEVCKRFDNARKELAKIVTEFPKQQTYLQKAQWEIASSFLTQARVVNSFSSTLARGQYVRASKELAKVAEKYSDHPNLGQIPQMLWTISQELESRAYYDEAILVWNELTMYNPMDSYAKQAALKIAQTYHHKLKRPLRAAEAYQELNFARGGNDQSLQNSIFQIGSDLKNEKRWVESLHVLESFVDSFPKHAQAGQALKMVGQIHQTNEAWEDAIKAYQRVIAEFHNGQWSQEAKWAIAECKINLSKWHEAKEDYLSYVETYHDSKMNEAKRRIELLKDLERYQGLVDEKGQRKAFDAQYQIAEIVKDRLQNKVKAIIEYRKVTSKWPKSHLADDALYAIGNTYLALGETTKAREALLKVGEKYPASPLADDALYLVGKSYEEEATKLASVTRESTLERAKEVAQKKAYTMSQSNRRSLMKSNYANVKKLKAAGKGMQAEQAEASNAFSYGQFNSAQAILFAQKAEQEVESLSAAQMADRQDKVNAALRKAVESFTSASKIAGADKADEALLQMATIYDTRLKDSKAAMETWLEIVRQFSGTTVAEDASWRIAEYYQREGKYAEAIEAYKAFLRNYRRSPKAGNAQFAVAENCEKLNQWVQAMDAYTNYITNFPSGPLVNKAKEQINWIKTYRL